jgi:hypothetical protein
MNFESLHYFLRIILIKMIKNSRTVSGFKPAHCYSARRGSLPRVAGRPADWAMAWRPGPAAEAARGTGAGCAWRWGGAAGPRASTDKVSQKRRREHHEGGDNTPDEVAASRAHPSSGSTCRGGAEAARRCPTVPVALRSWVAPVAGSCSARGEGRG